ARIKLSTENPDKQKQHKLAQKTNTPTPQKRKVSIKARHTVEFSKDTHAPSLFTSMKRSGVRP
ncbi:MAG TPA: hypothetical protein VFE65_20820, partial [Pseudonocardia sp.]|nr:hypothetical protein [Pseudonocardia sp.]